MVEVEDMGRHVEPQRIRGPPGRDRRRTGHEHLDDLTRHHDDEKPDGEVAEFGCSGARRGLIHDPANDQRPGQQQHRSDRDQHGERGPAAGIEPDESHEGAMR